MPMKKLCLVCLLAAGCAGTDGERVKRLEEISAMQVATSKRVQDEMQQLRDKQAADQESLKRDLRDLRQQIDRLRAEAAMVRRSGGAEGGPIADVAAEQKTQQEVELIKRAPNNPETAAAAARALRPISAQAVPLLVIELRQAMGHGDLDVVSALEKVFAGLDPETTVRAMCDELEMPQTRNLAAGILGALGHTAAREPLARRLGDGDFGFRFAVAEALVRLKGREARAALPVLIEGLKPEHGLTKNTLAFNILKSAAGFTCGYKTYLPDDEKRASAAAWEAWWGAHGDTFEFPE
jgi:HEAT repeat protein